MNRNLAFLAVGLGALLSGCFYEPVPDPQPYIPPGFDDQGDGIAIRKIDKPCEYGVKCIWIEVYVTENCPDGGDIDASFYSPEYDVAIDNQDGYFPALSGGQTTEMEFWTVKEDATRIDLTSRGCRDYD